ncbi:cell adhesion molecule 2-like [Pollicipes pollicipes]|uniref:cell adhesion molecule 2-like n=1 Tax=Pollicipes pollicipes TaxID=41117 RepID=UPI001884A02F|nr:cell adhesion molecule 2-like [Pollicipes pollicipes]
MNKQRSMVDALYPCAMPALGQRQADRLQVRLRLPQLAQQGQAVNITCEYRLRPSDQLYSVQWYKEGEEFYHYMPNTPKKKQAFVVPGIDVDLAASDARTVRLRSVYLSTSGQFRCEVSLEAPSFDTYYDYGDMIVVVQPRLGPQLHGIRPSYQVGERLRLNCTLAGSKPAAALNWYINEEKALPSQLVEHAPVRGTDGLETVTLGLDTPLTNHHVHSGQVKVNCTAAVGNVYWESRIATVPAELAQKLSVLESRDLLNGASAFQPGITRLLLPMAVLARHLLVTR